MKKIILITCMIITVFCTFTGCKNVDNSNLEDTNNESNEAVKESIVYGITIEPQGIFNPLIASSKSDKKINKLIFSSLLKANEDGILEEDLVDSFELSEDKKSLKFILKEDIKWHDGVKLTSADVEFTLKSMMDKNYTGTFFKSIGLIEGSMEYKKNPDALVSGIFCEDEKTVEVTLNRVYSPAIYEIGTIPIIPMHIWRPVSLINWRFETDILKKAVGSGAFKLSQNDSNNIELDAYDNYHGKKPMCKKIEFRTVNDWEIPGKLYSEEIDIGELNNISMDDEELLLEKDIRKEISQTEKIYYVAFNMRSNKVTAEKELRKAVAFGINRKKISDEFINSKLINEPLPLNHWMYTNDVIRYSYDINMSKKILDELMWIQGDQGLRRKDEKVLSLELSYNGEDPTMNKIAEQISENLKALGFDIKMNPMVFSKLIDKVVGNHDFDIYIGEEIIGFEPNFKDSWYKDSSSNNEGNYAPNITGYRNNIADKLIHDDLVNLDYNVRKEISGDLMKLLNEEIPYFPLLNENIVMGVSPKIENYNPNPLIEMSGANNWDLAPKQIEVIE